MLALSWQCKWKRESEKEREGLSFIRVRIGLGNVKPHCRSGSGSALMPKGRRALNFDDDSDNNISTTTPNNNSFSNKTSDNNNINSSAAAASTSATRSQSLRSALALLEGHPHSLVETLILNERVAETSLVLSALPHLRDDEMVLSYARKALAIDSIANTTSASTVSLRAAVNGNTVE